MFFPIGGLSLTINCMSHWTPGDDWLFSVYTHHSPPFWLAHFEPHLKMIIRSAFWHAALMSVRHKALVVIVFGYISDFPHHPRVLYKYTYILRETRGECANFPPQYINLLNTRFYFLACSCKSWKWGNRSRIIKDIWISIIENGYTRV